MLQLQNEETLPSWLLQNATTTDILKNTTKCRENGILLLQKHVVTLTSQIWK